MCLADVVVDCFLAATCECHDVGDTATLLSPLAHELLLALNDLKKRLHHAWDDGEKKVAATSKAFAKLSAREPHTQTKQEPTFSLKDALVAYEAVGTVVCGLYSAHAHAELMLRNPEDKI